MAATQPAARGLTALDTNRRLAYGPAQAGSTVWAPLNAPWPAGSANLSSRPSAKETPLDETILLDCQPVRGHRIGV